MSLSLSSPEKGFISASLPEKTFSRLVSTLQTFSREMILYLSNLQKINVFDIISKPDVIRGGSRTPKTSKTEFSMKTVTKNPISDAAEVLDIPLAIFYFAG